MTTTSFEYVLKKNIHKIINDIATYVRYMDALHVWKFDYI